MKYRSINDEIQRRYNEFPMKFAFSEEQLQKGLAELGCKDRSEVVSIGAGGFIRRTDVEAFKTMINECAHLKEHYIQTDDEFVLSMFEYELRNHEYCITYNYEDTLRACGLRYEDIENDQRLAKLLCQATDNYLSGYEDW